MSTIALVSPPRSKVTSAQLLREVSEYFTAGVQVRRGDTIVDVGANIGAFALRAAQACEGDVRILAFEPSPDTFAALSANFARNPVLQGTTHRLFHLGLSSGDHAGQVLSFYDFARFPTNSTFHLMEKRREFEMFFEDLGARAGRRVRSAVRGRAGRACGELTRVGVSALRGGAFGWWVGRKVMGIRRHTVRVDTLANVLAEPHALNGRGGAVERIDLLKIDVEGPELDILRGLDEPTWRKVRQVVLETHDRDGRLAQIVALLRDHGLGDVREVPQRIGDNGRHAVLVHARRSETSDVSRIRGRA